MESGSDSKGTLATIGGYRLSLDRIRSNVVELVRWWRREMLAMVPSAWRTWSQPALQVRATATELLVFNTGQLQPIDRLAITENAASSLSSQAPLTRCNLLLESELVLMTSLSLPSAAEANLRNVIGFSMDRYTPFREDEVYFDLRITKRDREHDRLDLMLYVVPRSTLERIGQRLAAAGIEAVSVDVIDPLRTGDNPAGINLLPYKTEKWAHQQLRINSVLLASAVAIFLALLVIPLYQRQQAVLTLESEIEALRVPVLEAERLRAEVDRRSETLRIIMQRRNSTPPTLELLRELTRLTPDEAWIGQVEIKGGRLRLTGEASAGSELLQALTASDYFADPRFEAPLTQNPKSGDERFVISLAIREKRHEP